MMSNIAIWQYIAIHSKAICNTVLTHIVASLVCMCACMYVCMCDTICKKDEIKYIEFPIQFIISPFIIGVPNIPTHHYHIIIYS